MKRTLRLLIQASWAYVGFIVCSAFLSLLWHVLSAGFHGTVVNGESIIWRISNTCALIAGLFLLGAVSYGAYIAVFRFSTKIIAPTVLFVAAIMLLVALYGEHRYLAPLMLSRRGAVLPLAGFAIVIIVVMGFQKFNRWMPPLLIKVLFPELTHSARRG
jgi:hypothetical protein